MLSERAKYPESCLADLYDPLTMPSGLVNAHRILDRAVDRCYRGKAFDDEIERIEFMLKLYSDLV